MSLSRLLPSTVNMAPVLSSRRPPCWTVTTSHTRRDRSRCFGQNSSTIAVPHRPGRGAFPGIDASQSRFAHHWPAGHGAGGPAVPSFVQPGSAALVGDSIAAIGAGTAGAYSIAAIRVWRAVCRVWQAPLPVLPACLAAALNGPLFRRVWRGPPVSQRRRRPSSPARLSLAFLARQEARLWPSSAVLRPFVHPIAQRRWGPPNGVRDRPPPA